jgi:hypothetical protein
MEINRFLPTHRTPDAYRQRAEECARKAALIKDAQIRTMMIGLADQWMFLADQSERLRARQRPGWNGNS